MSLFELEQLFSLACSLTRYRGTTHHPALFAANHPLHMRIQFQAQAIKQALQQQQHEHEQQPHDTAASRLSNVHSLMLLIASYHPAASLPYLPGVSDSLADAAGDASSCSFPADLASFIEPVPLLHDFVSPN